MNKFFLKFIGAISIVALLTSCGKKFNEVDSSPDNSRIDNLEANVLKLSSSIDAAKVSADNSYTFSRSAEVFIPLTINVEEGNAANFYAKLELNILDGDAEFYCLYKGGSNSETPSSDTEIERGRKYFFYGCFEDVDGDGTDDDLEYYPGYEIVQDANHSIQLLLLGADPRTDTTATTELELIWH